MSDSKTDVVERYDIDEWCGMYKAEEGDYCLYDDVQAELTRLRAELAESKAEAERYRADAERLDYMLDQHPKTWSIVGQHGWLGGNYRERRRSAIDAARSGGEGG